MKRGIALYEMADLYALQGVDLDEVAPPQAKSGMTQCGKWPMQEKTVRCIP